MVPAVDRVGKRKMLPETVFMGATMVAMVFTMMPGINLLAKELLLVNLGNLPAKSTLVVEAVVLPSMERALPTEG